MTLDVKDASGVTRTIKVNDDMAGTAGTPSANVLSTQGVAGGTPLPITTTAVTKTDISGTITAGGTAQTISAANPARRGWMIQNQSSGDLYFSTTATAVIGQPSFRLPPGGFYSSDFGAAPAGAISIIGATTGQAFAARTW